MKLTPCITLNGSRGQKGCVAGQHPAAWGRAILDATRTAQKGGLKEPAKASQQDTIPDVSLRWRF